MFTIIIHVLLFHWALGHQKRSRVHEKVMDDGDVPLSNPANEAKRDSGASSSARGLPAPSPSTNSSNMKNINKKKVKAKKKLAILSLPSSQPHSHVLMTSFSFYSTASFSFYSSLMHILLHTPSNQCTPCIKSPSFQ